MDTGILGKDISDEGNPYLDFAPGPKKARDATAEDLEITILSSGSSVYSLSFLAKQWKQGIAEAFLCFLPPSYFRASRTGRKSLLLR